MLSKLFWSTPICTTRSTPASCRFGLNKPFQIMMRLLVMIYVSTHQSARSLYRKYTPVIRTRKPKITSKRIQIELALGLASFRRPTIMRPSKEAMKGKAGTIRKNLCLRNTAFTTSPGCCPLNSQCLDFPLPTRRT